MGSTCVLVISGLQTVCLVLWSSNYDAWIEHGVKKQYQGLVPKNIRMDYLSYIDYVLDYGKPINGVPMVMPLSLDLHMPNRWHLLPILSQASGGIIVGQVTKHVGGVTKGFAIV